MSLRTAGAKVTVNNLKSKIKSYLVFTSSTSFHTCNSHKLVGNKIIITTFWVKLQYFFAVWVKVQAVMIPWNYFFIGHQIGLNVCKYILVENSYPYFLSMGSFLTLVFSSQQNKSSLVPSSHPQSKGGFACPEIVYNHWYLFNIESFARYYIKLLFLDMTFYLFLISITFHFVFQLFWT